MGNEMRLIVEIVDESTDGQDLDRAVRSLRQELVELDSVSATIGTGLGFDPDATGAKGDLNLLGTIAVSMISSAVPALVGLVGRWVQDRGRCVVRLSREDGTTIEVPHTLDRAQIEQIVASLVPK